MSWIKSASTFLDQLDNEAGQAAKKGVVSKTAEGVLERAKLEVVKTLATVEDQGIFEGSDEDSEQSSRGAAEGSDANQERAALAPLPPPPEAAVRFKPTLSSATKVAPVPNAQTKAVTPATADASHMAPEPELEPGPPIANAGPEASAAQAAPTAAVKPGSPSIQQPPASAGGSAPLDTALKQELEAQSSELARLRVSCRERDEALDSCHAEFEAAVAGYEANLDEFDRERQELVRFVDPRRVLSLHLLTRDAPRSPAQRKSNDELRGKVLSMERMLAAASATKSSFESESGAALEAKNKELKESAMSVQVRICGSLVPLLQEV
jgi:hypothetical protein